MTSSFRARLFRLFLLFAVIPTLLVTALGYYLLFSVRQSSPSAHSASANELSRYYNELLYDRINRQIVLYSAGGSTLATSLDFLFVVEAGRTSRIIGTDRVLPDRAVSEIIKAAAERPRGFIEWSGNFYQYGARSLSSGRIAYGGLTHSAEFASLLETVRSDLAARSTVPEMQAQYIYFLAALFVILLLITYAAASLLSSRISRNLARPLTELSDASRRIAEGDFKQTVTPAGTGELQVLISNFNEMARKLDQTTAQLAQSERVAAWRQVARRFAHELKNPLQPILVSLYRIEKQVVDTDAYDRIYEPLKAAADEVKHLNNLAERFSQLAKLPPPAMAELDLKEMCLSISELYRDKLASYSFTTDLPETPLVVRTDPSYVREAVHNLLQNSIDASREGGRIHLAIEVADREVHLSVADTGAGMDAETLASARLPYFTTKEKGTGLGLAIVEKSINELGGRLVIESSKGHGTRVTIVLPIRE
jgi:nitrogen fixation/metabolism regulation signal transduction histidine kinase